VSAEGSSHVATVHPATVEERLQPIGQLVQVTAGRRIVVRKPRDGEHPSVAFGDDVGAETRSPHLHQRWVLPAPGLGPLDPSMDRQERGARHAVLQPDPSRGPERIRTRREPLVEAAGASSKRQDLLTGEIESTLGHNPCVPLRELGAIAASRAPVGGRA
jgi:hypothetical protein